MSGTHFVKLELFSLLTTQTKLSSTELVVSFEEINSQIKEKLEPSLSSTREVVTGVKNSLIYFVISSRI